MHSLRRRKRTPQANMVYLSVYKQILYIVRRCDMIETKGEKGMLQLNTVSLHQVMRDFYTLTSIRIVIFDAQFREVLAYPQEKEGFCALLRQDPAGEAGCFVSDKGGCQKCAKSRKLVVYRCHAGLTEAVVPIMDRGGVLAYVMFGQIIPRESCESTKDGIKKRYPDFSAEVDRIPVKSEAELGAAATVLQAITAYVMTNRWVVSGKSEFIREIDRYIDEHIPQNITVEDICSSFRIGRTKLYELSMDYLGCGLAEYIRNRRILHAKKLLSETDMPVTEIAYAVGFTDYNHFSRVFRSICGMSARACRKSMRTEAEE